jgi:hypothetical protein
MSEENLVIGRSGDPVIGKAKKQWQRFAQEKTLTIHGRPGQAESTEDHKEFGTRICANDRELRNCLLTVC